MACSMPPCGVAIEPLDHFPDVIDCWGFVAAGTDKLNGSLCHGDKDTGGFRHIGEMVTFLVTDAAEMRTKPTLSLSVQFAFQKGKC